MKNWLRLIIFCGWLPATAMSEPIDFALPDLNGNILHLSDFRGHWVVVNFWASWCLPCVRELPELNEFQTMNPQHQVLGINFEQLSIEETQKFVTQHNILYPVLKIGEQPLVPLEPLMGLPTTALVTPDGELAARHTGSISRKMLEDYISDYSADE